MENLGVLAARGMITQRIVVLIVFSCLLLISTFVVCAPEELSVSMQLNSDLDEIIKMNPELKARTKVKKKPSGIMTIQGPLSFRFRYTQESSLAYPDVKLIIYPVEDYKTTYIHIFPQTKNMTNTQMSGFLQQVESELEKGGWKKQELVLGSHDKSLRDGGTRDYARFWLELNKPFNGIKKYEIVLTTFIDASITCGGDSQGEKASPDCQNRFVRIGFYNISS